MIQLGLLFLGIFIYIFGLNFIAKKRVVQMQAGGMLGLAAGIWALFSDIYVFLAMIPLFFVFRQIASRLVHKLFRWQFPKAASLDWATFKLRESYRENKKTLAQALSKGSGLDHLMKSYEENLEFCKFASSNPEIKKILKKHGESEGSLLNIFNEIQKNYGGLFVAKAIITAPFYLDQYLKLVDGPGCFAKPSEKIKSFEEISAKEKQFLLQVNESYGYPDVL